MLSFQSGGEGMDGAEIESFAQWWTGLDYVRMAIVGIGWLCALRALSLSGSNPTRIPTAEFLTAGERR
jgi:hypothetical protein